VCAEEVDAVRQQLAEVAAGKRFLLQGGDCAERFADCSSKLIENKLRILLQVRLSAAVLRLSRVVRVARPWSRPAHHQTFPTLSLRRCPWS